MSLEVLPKNHILFFPQKQWDSPKGPKVFSGIFSKNLRLLVWQGKGFLNFDEPWWPPSESHPDYFWGGSWPQVSYPQPAYSPLPLIIRGWAILPIVPLDLQRFLLHTSKHFWPTCHALIRTFLVLGKKCLMRKSPEGPKVISVIFFKIADDLFGKKRGY